MNLHIWFTILCFTYSSFLILMYRNPCYYIIALIIKREVHLERRNTFPLLILFHNEDRKIELNNIARLKEKLQIKRCINYIHVDS